MKQPLLSSLILTACTFSFLFCGTPIQAQISAPWDGTVATAFTGGTGTIVDPYLISNGNQLAYLASLVNNISTHSSTLGKHYQLTQSLDMNGWDPALGGNNNGWGREWTAIGKQSSTPFDAYFDGKGFEINNLYASSPTNGSDVNYNGLFAYAGAQSVIQNITVGGKYCRISGRIQAGGIVAICQGKIINCIFKGTVYNGGGICAELIGGSIVNCHNMGYVSGTDFSGGIVGRASLNYRILNCSNTGNVETAFGSSPARAAGIIGISKPFSNGLVSGCHNAGSVSGSSKREGFGQGIGPGTKLINCSNTGNVIGNTSGNSNSYAIGIGEGSVLNCYNTGSVSNIADRGSPSASGIGGCPVQNSYNTAVITISTSSTGTNKINPISPLFYTACDRYNSNNYYIQWPEHYGNSGSTRKTKAEFLSDSMVILLNQGNIETAYTKDIHNINGGFPIHKKYSVIFNTNGGTPVETLYIGYRSEIYAPVSHKKGYKLEAWYKDEALTTPWNMDIDTITQNIQLYAAWKFDWFDNAATNFAGGKGSKEEPYQIATPQQLAYLSVLSAEKGETLKKHYKLINPIQLDKGHWTPIGRNNVSPFEGSFDGGSFEIDGLYVNDAAYRYAGLFGYVQSDGEIKNVIIGKNTKIRLSCIGTTEASYAAGIIAYGYLRVSNCENHGEIESISNSPSYLGGIIGSGYNISFCINTATIRNATTSAGGIAGSLMDGGTIQNSYNTGIIEKTSDNRTDCYYGGIVGLCQGQNRITISNSYNTGIVRYTGTAINMGFIKGGGGSSNVGTITNCYYLARPSTGTTEAYNGIAVSQAFLRTEEMVAALNGSPSSYAWQQNTDPYFNYGAPIFNTATTPISFVVNGGESIATKEFQQRLSFSQNGLPTPLRKGYTFEQWYTDSSFKKPLNANLQVTDTLRTLYARWQSTLSFNTNGGSAVANKTYYADSTFLCSVNTGLAAAPNKSSYVFAGWYDRNQNLITNTHTVIPSDTLFAFWEVKVNFNLNGGDTLNERKYIGGLNYNQNHNTDLPTPIKTGYIFGGWYAGLDYGAQRLSSDIVPLIFKDTLYAQWGDKVWVDFNTMGGEEILAQEYFPLRAYNASYSLNGVGYNRGLPTNPTKSNAIFKSWILDDMETPITASSMVLNRSHTINAIWSEKRTIQFVSNGGTEVASREYYPAYAYTASSPSNNPGLPSNPSKANAHFLGWFENPGLLGSPISDYIIIGDNVYTLYAKWSEKRTIQFVSNGGSEVASIEYYPGYAYRVSSPINNPGLPSNPSKANAHFLGWFENPGLLGSPIGDYIIIGDNVYTLYAKWSEKRTIQFVSNGGTEVASREYYPGYAYRTSSPINNSGIPADPSKTNARFLGWFENAEFSGSAVFDNSIIGDNVYTLYAKWSEKRTIQFVSNGGTEVASREYYPGYAYRTSSPINNSGIPADPSKTNARFLGWFENAEFSGSAVFDNSIIGDNVYTLYAKWSEKISVSFETYGGTNIANKDYYTDYTYNNSSMGNTGLPSNPTKDSAYFLGWFDSENFTNQVSNSNSVQNTHAKLYAKWGEKILLSFIDYQENTRQNKNFYHGITYATTPANTNFPIFTSLSTPAFLGWFSKILRVKNKTLSTDVVPNKHHVLHARWTVKVHFNTNGGNTIDDRLYSPAISYNEMPNEGLPPKPTKTGAGFAGWFLDVGLTQAISENTPVFDGEHTLYAKWKVPTMVKVSFNTNGGAVIADKTYQADGLNYTQSPNTGLPTPSREGRYTWDGWYKEADFTTKVTNVSLVEEVNHILYAKWNEIPPTIINVSFETKGGSILSDKTYQADGLTYGQAPNEGLPTPTHSTKFFTGWYKEVALTNVISNNTMVPQTNHTLYAKWSEIEPTKVGVSFITNGGNTIEDKIYQSDGLTYGQAPNEGLPTPTHSTKFFAAWYKEIGLTNAISNNTMVPETNHTLYAKWLEVEPTKVGVSFITNGGNTIEDKIYQADGLTYGQAPNEGLPTPIKEGAVFENWYKDVSLLTLILNTSLVPENNHTLYAKWKTISIDQALSLTDIQVYPNPVTQYLFISTEAPISKVQLYNTNGALILDLPGSTKQINMGNLQNGYYILYIYTDKGIVKKGIVTTTSPK